MKPPLSKADVSPDRIRRFCQATILIVCLAACGCQLQPPSPIAFESTMAGPQVAPLGQPALAEPLVWEGHSLFANPVAPRTIRNSGESEPWPLSLAEVLHVALTNNEAMQGLGVRATHESSTPTVFDPAIRQTDPLFGDQAALSQFDSQLSTALLFGGNSRTLNNLADRGLRDWRQETGGFFAALEKTNEQGTRLALRHASEYDSNNAPLNLFPSSWDTYLEGEVRHPLLQGGGREFNLIAGPNALPGVYRGIMIARIRDDIALNDFEIAVRDFLRTTQRAYWRLYLAYRDVDAKRANYAATLETWRIVKTRAARGDANGAHEALARERFFVAKTELEDALNGPTNWRDGEAGAAVIDEDGGLYGWERRLRQLMGIAINDGRLIRPNEDPPQAEVVFDWASSLAETQWRHPEVRRQERVVKRRELELTAASNFGLIQMDVLGGYRVGGFGDGLFGKGSPNASAYADFGNLQQWRVGVEVKTPYGNRIGKTAIRNAELQLARARAVQTRQANAIIGRLSAAYAQMDRDYQRTRNRHNRLLAARQRHDALRVQFLQRDALANDSALEFLLESQQRLANAETEFHRSLVDYNLAIANFHWSRGSYLESLGVYLAEGGCGDGPAVMHSTVWDSQPISATPVN